LPPSHGVITGFYSGEFPTNRVNPFAPRYNNNPAASHAIAIEESVFAVRPGEAGVNVRPDASHAGGCLASTGTFLSGGGIDLPFDGGEISTPPWNAPANQDGFTVTHRPIKQTPSAQQSTQQTRVAEVTPFADGTIARITFPALNYRTASVRPGLDLRTLDEYVGHFPDTSQWDGGIALASHNRGRGSFFAGIWTLQNGDRIFYETTMGVRIFEVANIDQIYETDMTSLDHTHANTLVLITCVYNRPALRWRISATEVI
jgi:LPXTG-site transpeptidase (sortase) family protein